MNKLNSSFTKSKDFINFLTSPINFMAYFINYSLFFEESFLKQ